MSDEIRISGIVEESIVDGPGLRYVLFTQGCPHHCKGSHNPTTHPFDGGRMVSPDWVFADVRKNPIVRGVTFSGGEPFVQSGKLAPLAEKMRRNALIKTICKPRLTGGCDLHLAMSEGDGAVLELKLLVPGEAQAEKMSENFRRNAEEIYGHL